MFVRRVIQKFCVLGVAFFIFLFCFGQTRGEALQDTLRPTGDNNNAWFTDGCTGHYACVDETTADDWDTYLYRNYQYSRETFSQDPTFIASIDSLVMHIRTTAYGANDSIDVGWDYWSESLWYFHTEYTIVPPSDGTWTNFTVVSTTDENGQAWTYQKINGRRFGFRCRNTSTERYVTQYFVIVYGIEAEAVSKAKERRLRNLYGAEE
jgi:hypothetical protein